MQCGLFSKLETRRSHGKLKVDADDDYYYHYFNGDNFRLDLERSEAGGWSVRKREGSRGSRGSMEGVQGVAGVRGGRGRMGDRGRSAISCQLKPD